jgi:hypothetical protein
VHQNVDNRGTLPVTVGFPLKNLMELHVKNLILTLGIASALLLAACGKKEEAAAPAAAPAATEAAPAATAPAATDAAAPAAAPATSEAAKTEEKPAEQPKQ